MLSGCETQERAGSARLVGSCGFICMTVVLPATQCAEDSAGLVEEQQPKARSWDSTFFIAPQRG